MLDLFVSSNNEQIASYYSEYRSAMDYLQSYSFSIGGDYSDAVNGSEIIKNAKLFFVKTTSDLNSTSSTLFIVDHKKLLQRLKIFSLHFQGILIFYFVQ